MEHGRKLSRQTVHGEINFDDEATLLSGKNHTEPLISSISFHILNTVPSLVIFGMVILHPPVHRLRE